MTTLTRQMILDQMQRVIVSVPDQQIPREIRFTPDAVKPTDERLFPVSRHRSRRVLKKLLKRHGGEFRMAPAILFVGYTVYAHPSYSASLNAKMREMAELKNTGINAGIEPRIGGLRVYF